MSLTAMFYAIRQQNNIFKISEEKICEPSILYPVNLAYKYKGHRKTIINVQEFRKYFSLSLPGEI